MKFKFIKSTMVAGVRKLRWECPYCNKRFNLVPKTIDVTYTCGHCKILSYLEK